MTLLLVARHGQTEPNRAGLLLGRGDPALTDTGRSQAAALAGLLERRRPSVIVSSPLQRCVQTAEAIAAPLGIEVTIDERLIEADYGEWEGMPLADIPADASERWRSDPDFRPPGGESLADVAVRVAAWCEEQSRSETVVAVTHVSPIKATVAWALGATPTVAWRLFVEVASLTTIGRGETGPVLLGFNERAHLHDA